MKQIAITGSDGFIGKNLKSALLSAGHSIHDFRGDIRKTSDVDSFLATLGHVDVTFHFAGISSPSKCEFDKETALTVNTQCALELAEKISRSHPNSLFIFPSTGQVYSATSSFDDSKIDESFPLKPINFYAETKLKAENLLGSLATKESFKTIVLRLFNHTHKSQDPSFFLPSLYRQILQKSPEIKTGNLNLIRDFGAIQDLLTALKTLTGKGPSENFSIYNICSGKGKKLKVLAEELARQMNSQVEWTTDPKNVRLGEPDSIIGSSLKFQKEFSWDPCHAISERDLIKNFLTDL